MYQHFIKRTLDIVFAAFGLVALSPLLLGVAVWLHFANRGAGAFFLQPRAGLHGRVFRIVKFKTMTDARDPSGRLLPDSLRLTAAGRLLRSTSIDELPQLLNILWGDMSFVGPRPLPVAYLPLYSPRQRHRHDVRPGLTGWAQCHGRNAISWTRKFDYDLWYVSHLSLPTDLRAIVLTLGAVFCRRGISSAGSATAEVFNGHN